MHKSRAGFFMVSLVAAVISTGCAHKRADEQATAPTDTGAMSTGAGTAQSSDVNVTASRWAQVETGPLTVTGIVGLGRFDGEAVCYASAGSSCGNSSTPAAELGTRVFACTAGSCAPENGGRVEAGQILCCGSVKGNGGQMRVGYTK